MRRALLILPLAVLAVLIWAVATGADARVAQWAAGWQRDFQNALAGALRSLRAGEPGAVGLLAGLCFAYGVAHAVGPGHGKVLIGGYGMGRRVPLFRLSAIAMAASLGQALTAVLIAGVGMALLGWSRTQATGTVEGLMAPASSLAIGLIGLWLALRGGRKLWRLRPGAAPPAPPADLGHAAPAQAHGAAHDHVHEQSHPHAHSHAHSHAHDAGACGCGHRHGPTLEEVGAATRPRDIAALIGSIAIRPCSGALLLLVLTWHMGIVLAGIAGTFAMALGTGAVTVAVAVAAVSTRESALGAFAGGGAIPPRLMPCVELAAGMVIALVAIEMFSTSGGPVLR
ncbi:hypothetical protein EKE94_10580 [Mesobaculum littorinae]|uniref:Nickel/cobalt efflux system n=1 Tax=Mesobaculum littorinae TaxID=2486419 RepID=A0A438AGS2_9RHOB|nr:hypothetical protein [Mesobaculum littorinae]RVV97910.1 hypothetical protein EKE94_10580 [Mesobaculum littorinae]